MAFQAYANGDTCTSETPKAAAIAFFEQFPNRRKCNLIEGKINGAFFEVTYDPKAWPKSYKNITKKMISTLP